MNALTLWLISTFLLCIKITFRGERAELAKQAFSKLNKTQLVALSTLLNKFYAENNSMHHN